MNGYTPVCGWWAGFTPIPVSGVFLSGYDLFIHRHFFAAPDQIALVIDPLRKKTGVFIWKKGEIVEGDFGSSTRSPPERVRPGEALPEQKRRCWARVSSLLRRRKG